MDNAPQLTMTMDLPDGPVRVTRSATPHDPNERMVVIETGDVRLELFPRQAVAFAAGLRLMAGKHIDFSELGGEPTTRISGYGTAPDVQ